MHISCPCCFCQTPDDPLIEPKRSPVLNNVVYETEEHARNCVIGTVELVQCNKCGFVFNIAYNEDLIVYDETYNNVRNTSPTYDGYLDFIIAMFSEYLSCESIVLEIGCGKGEFLRKLSDMVGCKAVGYDTTYQGDAIYNNRVFFYKNYFRQENDNKRYDMLILRHVLEHVPNPFKFLQELCNTFLLKKGSHVFVEVPNFEWILRKGVFYDITYEHCNYFFSETLVNLMTRVGVEVKKVVNVFNEQILLLHGIYEGDKLVHTPSATFQGTRYLLDGFRISKRKLIENIRRAKNSCVWGASGKGVIFLSELPIEIIKKITYIIDINLQKQGKFLPISGKRVDPPDVLKQVKGELLVLIMNNIYEKEIRTKLSEMRVNATLLNIFT